jgi:hypothetical protein
MLRGQLPPITKEMDKDTRSEKGEIRKQDSKLSNLLSFGKGFFGGSPEPPQKKEASKSVGKKPPCVERILPRRIPTEDWEIKPPCAVIVTIHSNGSYDRMFREVSQHSPDNTFSVALFEMGFDTISPFLDYLTTGGIVPDSQSKSAIKDVVDVIAQVAPSSVLFNFECCSFCARKDFKNIRDVLMQFIHSLMNRGFMAMFSDFSLKALIGHWDSALLGPCPLHHIGKCEEHIKLSFDCDKLKQCASEQLRNLGALSEGHGKATIKCMGNNIIYTLRDAYEYQDAQFSIEVLSIATDFGKFWTLDPRQHKLRKLYLNNEVGYAGHVMITYHSGGKILASAGHWLDLNKIEVQPNVVLREMNRLFGSNYAHEFKVELDNAVSDETVQEIVQRSVRQIMLTSAPCAYSMRSVTTKHNHSNYVVAPPHTLNHDHNSPVAVKELDFGRL